MKRKFRVWCKRCWTFKGKEFSEMIDGNKFYEIQHYANTVNAVFNDDRFVFMQYLDIKDIDGEELCEGDIIDVKESISNIRVIEYDSYFAAFKAVYNNNGEKHYYQISETIITERGWKKIGNIYENPELLEAGK